MPPTLTPYAGPKITMLPGAPVVMSAAAGRGGAATDLANASAIDGAPYSLTVNINSADGNSAGNRSPIVRLPFSIPSKYARAKINGFNLELLDATVAAVGGAVVPTSIIWSHQVVDAIGSLKGQSFGWHEIPAGPTPVFDIQSEYEAGFGGTGVNYPDRYYDFGLGYNVVRCFQFYGFEIFAKQILTFVGSQSSQTFGADALRLTLAITPEDPGDEVWNCAISSTPVTSVSGATLGIPIDSAWGTEVAWTSPDNARLSDSSTAYVSSTPDAYAQSQFLVATILPDQIGDPGDRVGCQFRVPMSCRGEGVAPDVVGYTPPVDYRYALFASVGEFALLDMDGNVLAKSTTRPLYDLHNLKIGAIAERAIDLCLDISRLTVAQMRDCKTRGFKFAVRTNLWTPNYGSSPTEFGLLVNSFQRLFDRPTWSYSNQRSLTNPPGSAMFPTCIQPKTFLSGMASTDGPITLGPLQPLFFSSTGFRAWRETDTDVHGFTAESVQLSNTEEVLGNVMLSGRIHGTLLPPPMRGTLETLKSVLRLTSRARGIIVEGITSFR